MGQTAASFLSQLILHDETQPPTRDTLQDALRQGGAQVGISRLDELMLNKALTPIPLPAAASVSTSTTSNGLGVPMPYACKVWAFTAGALTVGATCTADLMHTPSGGSATSLLSSAVNLVPTAGTSMAAGTMSESADAWGEVAKGELLHMRVINGITTAATGIVGFAWVQRL